MKGDLPMYVRKIITAKMARKYRNATKKEKSVILNSLEELTGFNRSYLMRRLRTYTSGNSKSGVHRGRKNKYTKEDVEALRDIWELMDFPCGRRLKAIMEEVIRNLEKNGRWKYSKEVKKHLLEMSSSTIDRKLREHKISLKSRKRRTTKPGTLLRNRIEMLRFHEWWDERPGFLEIDLVAHCGSSPSGEYINTLNCVDVRTGWAIMEPLMGKSRRYTLEAFIRAVKRLPFRVLGIHSDNGGEFINDHFYNWCVNNKINFTRGRAYRKNDNPRVEAKNYTVVRRAVGYWRYDTENQLKLMRELYLKLEEFHNFFQPTSKVVRVERREDGKYRKIYDKPRTPYQRVLESPYIEEEIKEKLRERYESIDLYQLRREIITLIRRLYRSAKRRLANEE